MGGRNGKLAYCILLVCFDIDVPVKCMYIYIYNDVHCELTKVDGTRGLELVVHENQGDQMRNFPAVLELMNVCHSPNCV